MSLKSENKEGRENMEGSDTKWKVDKELIGSVLYTPEDVVGEYNPLTEGQNSYSSGLMQSFTAEQNKMLLNALDCGVNSVEIELERGTVKELRAALQGVNPELISTFFSFTGGSQLVTTLYHLPGLYAELGADIENCKGGLRLANTPPFVGLDREIRELLPGFAFNYFEATSEIEKVSRAEQLEELLVPFIKLLASGDQDPKDCILGSSFRLYVGNEFISELIKVRAFHKIWALVLDEAGIELTPPDLEVSLSDKAYSSNIYHNFIRSASAGLSSRIGGVKRLHFINFTTEDTKEIEDPLSFTSRIHANISHLLKHESHLDIVVDPAAGSYLIEELTDQLAEKAWNGIVSQL